MFISSKKNWPLITSTGMLWIIIFLLLITSIHATQGQLIYPLDDTYIHLAISKNFSQYGIWGITKDNFTSSSSSLFWTLLLSFTNFLFGANNIAPLGFTIVFATLLLYFVSTFLKKSKLPSVFILFALLSIIFFTPLPVIIFTGLEHVLHALLTISFIWLSASILTSNIMKNSSTTGLLALAFLLTMTRFESMFVIFIVGCLFILRKKWVYSMTLFGFAALPIVSYGIISLKKGWYFLPNSVLLKGRMPDFSSFKTIISALLSPWNQIVKTPHISLILLVAVIILIFQYMKYRMFWKQSLIMNIIFLFTLSMHIQFAKLGWFYRYEAYLMSLGIFIIFIAINEFFPKNMSQIFSMRKNKSLLPRYIAIAFFSLTVISILVLRGSIAILKIPQATKNIYEQQYQMGLFLGKFNQGKGVATNDVGAVNYLADIKCLDLWGLGNLEVAKAKRGKYYNTQWINELAKLKNIKIAIVYDSWFSKYGGLPSEWIKVEEWTITNNVVCSSDTVSFYAVDPSERDILKDNLRQFSFQLPKDVVRKSYF